ncbi:MAG: NAD-dependent epimerase/dehydratase family protein [bacterium]|jgi:nucleoside-diphosphate-sugar epimerase
MSTADKETVLVTGSNGFVGSRLCRQLIADNFRPIAGIRRGCNTFLIDELQLECRYGDITRPESLPAMAREVDFIIHNAGLVKAHSPEQFYKVNVEGTRNILEAALTNSRLKKFVLISSLAAAGPSRRGQPLTEELPTAPITEYGRSKAGAEKMVLAYRDKINSVIIRPPGIYGPGDIEMFAFFQILNNRVCPYLGNWNRRLQLVYVDDLCAGVSLALTSETKSGATYFIAEDRSYSYAELIAHLRRAVGRVALPIYLPGAAVRFIAFLSENLLRLVGKPPMFTVEKANEILSDWEVSIEKAAKELGYRSQTPFPVGALNTIHWYREEGWL